MLELKIKKNPERAPNFGKTYGQNVEPEGTYVTKNGGFVPEGWFEGKAFLNNPLFIDIDDNSLVKWKNELADEMKAKGSKLTNKLISKGYDALITRYSDGGYGEIILFPNAKFYLNKKEMKESRIYSLMETYQAITEDDLAEIAYVPSEGTDEKSNQYLIDQAKTSILFKSNKEKVFDNEIGYELNLDFPNKIINLRGNTFLLALFSSNDFENIEDINIIFMVRYEDYKDGIKIQYTGSSTDFRKKKEAERKEKIKDETKNRLAIKCYKALKEKFNKVIYSDTAQSSFSRYFIWEKLYNDSPNSVQAYDTKTDQYFEIEKNEKNEMVYYDETGKVKTVYSKKDNGIILAYI